jgi:hypothetical protein
MIILISNNAEYVTVCDKCNFGRLFSNKNLMSPLVDISPEKSKRAPRLNFPRGGK